MPRRCRVFSRRFRREIIDNFSTAAVRVVFCAAFFCGFVTGVLVVRYLW